MRDLTVDEANQQLGDRLWNYTWDVRNGLRHRIEVHAACTTAVFAGESLRECVEKAQAWYVPAEREIAESISTLAAEAAGERFDWGVADNVQT